MFPLDTPLGQGAHVIIHAAIGHRGRAYAPSPFVRNHATTLIAAGMGWQDARRFLLHLITHVPAVADFDQAVALAAGLIQAPNGWNYLPMERCVDAFLANRNLLTGANWAAIGRALGVDRAVDTIAFARLALWNAGSILLLAQGFAGANPNHFVAQQWLTLAAQLGANEAAGANAMCRLNGWTAHQVNQAFAQFAVGAHGLNWVQWATLASHCGVANIVDIPVFAGIAGWTFAAKDQLAQNRTAGNTNNFTAQQWVALAPHVPADGHAAVTAFARINGWTAPGVLALAQAFAAGNARAFAAQQWAAIAAELGVDEHAETAEFARMAAWTAAGAGLLARAFHAGNPNNHTAAQWAALGPVLGVDVPGNIAPLARMRGRLNSAWNAPSVLQVAQNRMAAGGNPNGFTPQEWVAIAAEMGANQHANLTAFAQAPAIGHAGLVALATLFDAQAHGRTAAEWLTMAQRIGGVNWARYTERAMYYRSLGWRDSIPIRTVALGPTVNWHLEGSDDGVVYRQTNVTNPHITLHNLLNDSPDNWWRNGNFHVVTVGGFPSPYDHNRRVYNPYVRRGYAPTVRPPAVVEIAESFCDGVLP